MDTVTLLGAAIRGLLKVAQGRLEAELRRVLGGADDYASLAKPQIDWDDQAARAALVDARARDAHAVLEILQGRSLPTAVAQAARLLAAVVGQDLEQGTDGSFRIARKVAADRVISTVDPDARHGHKSSARGFDGYKGHASVDPTASWCWRPPPPPATSATRPPRPGCWLSWSTRSKATRWHRPQPWLLATVPKCPRPPSMATAPMAAGRCWPACTLPASTRGSRSRPRSRPAGTSPRTSSRSTLPPAPSPAPAQRAAPILYNPNPHHRHHGQASFGPACTTCPLRGQCTSAAAGRTITITAYEQELAAARARQADPDRAADYRATRPKVQRKLAHLVRRRHGGRRVRVRGLAKVAADFNLLAAAVNLARLGVLGLQWTPTDGWAAA